MKHYLRAFALLAALILPGAAATAEPMDVGSCYSVRPICLSPQVPICICDIMQNCFWACK